MTPETLLAMAFPVILGWMGFTWRRAENALEKIDRVSDKVDRVELKVAEEYLTKKDFELHMDRLFGTLGEMKGSLHYLTERVDYHVNEQALESKTLRKRLEQLGERRAD